MKSQAARAEHPECRSCPFKVAGHCLIEPSRILIYFYCPASEGFRGEKVIPAIYASAGQAFPKEIRTA